MTEILFPKLKDGDQKCGHPTVSGNYGVHVLPYGHKYINSSFRRYTAEKQT
jgi:hypothetical protein